LINPESAIALDNKFRQEVQTHCPEAICICVGCKEDIRTEIEQGTYQQTRGTIDTHSGELLAKRLKCLFYMETSALTGKGLDRKNIFDLMVQTSIYQNYFQQRMKKSKCILC
jgi:hypothetical protein